MGSPVALLAVPGGPGLGRLLWARVSCPISRAYYQRKPDQGKPPWARPSSPWPTAAS